MTNVMSKAEYHHLVAMYDDRRIEALIDAIPLNVNRAGKTYKKMLKNIYETTLTRRL